MVRNWHIRVVDTDAWRGELGGRFLRSGCVIAEDKWQLLLLLLSVLLQQVIEGERLLRVATSLCSF